MNSSNSSITGTADEIAELLCGPRQQDEHCRRWRWHMDCRDDKNRMDNVNEAARQLIAEHHARNDRRAARALLQAAE